ncbi:MAG: hypothetical protein AB2693_30000, partial [Candidatus Thiodiazotropha sp.]
QYAFNLLSYDVRCTGKYQKASIMVPGLGPAGQGNLSNRKPGSVIASCLSLPHFHRPDMSEKLFKRI